MSINVLNPIENQVPDLPTIKLDVCPFALHILKKSTPEKLQFVVGCVDGSLRMYTAKPTEEWWKPDTYDDYQEYCSAQGEYRAKRQKLSKDDEDDDEEDRDADEDEEERDELGDEDEDEGGLFGDEEEEEVEQFNLDWSIQQSSLSIRAISQVPEIDHLLYTATRDGRLGQQDVERGSLLRDFENVKKCGFEKIEAWDCNLVVTGDEQGRVCGYDMRVNNNKPVMDATKAKKHDPVLPAQTVGDFWKYIPKMQCTPAWKEDDHADYITGLSLGRSKNTVAYTSADKCVSIYNARSGKFQDISAGEDNEQFSCCYVKDDSMLVCGTDKGPLSIYSASDVAYYKNRLKVHQKSVGLITRLDQDTVLTCCDDGIVRVIMIDPNRVIGVVGVHQDHISAIDTWRQPGADDRDDFVWANDIVGTCSHDYTVRFWRMNDMQLVRRERTTNEIKAMKAAKGEKKVAARKAEEFDDSDFGDLGDEFKTAKTKKANHDVGVAQAAFNADQFRKKHNSTLAGMYTDERSNVNVSVTSTDNTKPAVASRVKPQPELGRQASKQKKVKHGSKNFFNGL